MVRNPALDAYIAEALEKAAQYGRDVINNRIVVNRYVRLAVKRHYQDLQTAHLRGWVFDEEAAGFALGTFFFLRHSKGEWAGQRVELEPWQCWIIACVFGWVSEETGLRRFKTAYEEIARKNGKTTKLAGIGLHLLTRDQEGGPEVYSAATKRDQARIMFEESCRMVAQSPSLRKRLDVQQGGIYYRKGFGKFQPLSADANSLDGLNPHGGLVDELHAHKTSEIWDVLKSAFGSRLQGLLWAITTAGFNKDGICYEVRDYAIKVLEGVIDDDSFFAIIYALDDGDDWNDVANWIKANPNLGVSVSLDYLRDQAKQAAIMPRALSNFLTKHMNVWVSGESLWCNVEKWKACGTEYTLDELLKDGWVISAYGGLDLASVSDLTSFGMVLVNSEGKWRTWHRHYLPEDAVLERLQKSNVPYDTWARQGWLQLTPGNVTDYDYVEHDIAQFMEDLPLNEIAYDRWNSSQLVNNLMEKEAPMIGFGQGYASMNAPMKELERRYLAGEIEHPNDPVLTWAMSNVVSQQDPAGNVKPAKDKAKEKIDPAVALIMAVGRAMAIDEVKPKSIYETTEI